MGAILARRRLSWGGGELFPLQACKEASPFGSGEIPAFGPGLTAEEATKAASRTREPSQHRRRCAEERMIQPGPGGEERPKPQKPPRPIAIEARVMRAI